MNDGTVIRFIDEQMIPGKRLGRHVRHDPRSRDYAFGEAVPAGQLLTVRHRRYGGPLDQGNLGSCTGNATAGAINTAPLHQPGRLLKEMDAVAIYSLATHLDGFDGFYPPDDTGSDGLSAAQAAQSKKFISSYKHAFSVEEALTALQVTPLITGVNWYEGFDNPDANGEVKIAGQVRGGHEFEVLGFELRTNPDDALVEAENSWGYGWGRKGRFYFTVATWRQLLSEQGDATILVR